MKVLTALAVVLSILSVQAAIPKEHVPRYVVPKHVFRGHLEDPIAYMKQTKMEAISSGNRVIESCDEYFDLASEAQTRQKTEITKCTTTHNDAITTATAETKTEADALHERADAVGDKLKACQKSDDVIGGVVCLGKTSDGETKTLSKISSESSKLLNKHDRKVKVADNSYDFCKTDVTYFYSDVITEIMGLQRECVLYGEKEDYEIPEFKGSF